MVNDFPRGLIQFYRVIYQMVDDPSFDSIISWSSSNKSFIIWDQEALKHRQIFARFNGPHYPNFLSMLKLHGFRRVHGSERLEFGDENFVKGQPELMKNMQDGFFRRSSNKFINNIRAKRAVDRLQLDNLRI